MLARTQTKSFEKYQNVWFVFAFFHTLISIVNTAFVGAHKLQNECLRNLKKQEHGVLGLANRRCGAWEGKSAAGQGRQQIQQPWK